MNNEPSNEPAEVHTALDFARDELAATRERNNLARLKAEAADEAERGAHTLVNNLERHLANVGAEPAAAAELAELTSRLRARLERPPTYPGDHRSPTRARVLRELNALALDTRSSAADKLSRVRQLARDFGERRQLDLLVFANSERR